MRALHIIMPMAGLGQRFSDAGIKTPKPLIEFENVPLFKRALASLYGITAPLKHTFIIRKSHVEQFEFDKLLSDLIPASNIVIVNRNTRGAVETCLKAEQFIDERDAVLVLDCDLQFSSTAYYREVDNILDGKNDAAGLLLSFRSNHSRFSYARLVNNTVVETAEKRVISSNALVGAYFFSWGQDFIASAKRIMKTSDFGSTDEYYISYLYNDLIQRNKRIELVHVDNYQSFGTPQELKTYNG